MMERHPHKLPTTSLGTTCPLFVLFLIPAFLIATSIALDSLHPLTTAEPDKMAEHEHENVPALPIASRMTARPKPHVGPGIEDYQKLHSLTVGPGSDEFWSKVSLQCLSQRRNWVD